MTSRPAARFRPANSRRRRLISLTPLIDVVFILLVFFMLVSSFLDWRVIVLDAAEADPLTVDAADGLRGSVVVDLAADGALRLSGEAVTRETLAARIAALVVRRDDLSVIVRSAPGLPVQALVDLLDTLETLGPASLGVQRAP